MNERRVFRKYTQSQGKEAKEFVEVIDKFYNNDVLITKDKNGNLEETYIDYKDMVHWMFKNYKE